MAKTPCFNCGEPTGTVVNRIQPPTLAKRVCTAAACWKAWWKLADATPPSSTKKGRNA